MLSVRRFAPPFAAMLGAALTLPMLALAASGAPAAERRFDAVALAPYVRLALTCAHQEYPNHLSHSLLSDADARPPRELTPAFFGCYDWHSSVHGHWLLVRALRRFPDAPFAAEARAVLDASLTLEHIAGEKHYLEQPERASFERPYGLAWLLQLAAELRAWDDPGARRWSAALAPLETTAAERLERWLPKLHYPIRIGEHGQTAFSFGLVWDWAVIAGNEPMQALLRAKARDFYGTDRDCPLAYEPSGEDFLSPCLGEADFMRRVLPPARFARWLRTFLPQIPAGGHVAWLPPAVVTDRSDPRLAHLDGLNLSRAWMLAGIADALPRQDPRIAALRATAAAHARTALADLTGEHYEGGHWLGTYAIYLTTRAGAKATGSH